MSLTSFAKKYFEPILITILVIVGIVVFIYVRNLIEQNQQLKEQVNATRLTKQGTSTKIETRYIDSSGNQHSVINSNTNTITAAMLKDGAVKIGLLDTVSSALNIAKDQINQITKTNYSLSRNNFLLQKKIDSLSNKIYYSYNDNHLHYSEYDLNDSTRQGKYTYNGDITTTDYSKKKVPIIGRTFDYTDIYSNDTSFKVNSVNRLTIEHVPKIWSFKLKVHTGAAMNMFSTGVKAELGYKNFTASYGRYYNFIKGNKVNLIGLDYTLIGF